MQRQISNTDKGIINLWKEYESVKGVERNCKYSRYKIIKCLTTHGYVLNETHQRILQLYEQGKTIEQISKSVGVGVRCVKTYLPRVRPEYGQHYSPNAKNIHRWREKKKEEKENGIL